VSELAHILADLTRALAAGRPLLVLSDYDGTLTPIVKHPADAWLSHGVREDLEALTQSPQVHVGIVSGRPIGDLRARVGLSGIVYAGCHGLEIEGPGFAFRHGEALDRREMLRSIARVLHRRLGAIPGVLLEPKGLSVAVHYRGVHPRTVGRVVMRLEQALRPYRTRLSVIPGKKVLEILPTMTWNKGSCALLIRDLVHPIAGTDLAMTYLGDDVTDEIAFGVLRGTAITVRVGGSYRGSSARYHLRHVEDVRHLISALAAEVRLRAPT
jgi:trehalose-phosphatase